MIDADNSCLFNSVAYCLENKRLDMAYELRELIASVVISSTDEYNEAVLGKPPAEYAEWIMKADSWGGALECRIFAQHYSTIVTCIGKSAFVCSKVSEPCKRHPNRRACVQSRLPTSLHQEYFHIPTQSSTQACLVAVP